MANKRKKVEFVRAITGPSIESKNEELPRYSTWNFGEGIKVNPSPYFQKHEIEIDEAYVVDLINQHGGGGGGNPSAWAFYSASHDVDMDGKRITNMAEPVLPSDATPRSYVDSQINEKQTFISGSKQIVGNIDHWSIMATTSDLPMSPSNPLGRADGFVAVQPTAFTSKIRGKSFRAPYFDLTGSIRLRDRLDAPISFDVDLDSRLPEHTGSLAFRMSPSGPNTDAFVRWEAPYFSGSRLDLFDANNVTLPNNEPSILAALNYLDDRIESGSGGGGGDASLLTSDDANTFITASNDSLLVGFDQYSKKLVVEELDPESPEIMLSKSIESWDDIAGDQTIWGSVDGYGSAFMRTNYAFVEDSNNKSWGFQWISNVFEEHSNHGINITQGDHRLTFATVDTSSGDFYFASDTFAEDYWSRLDIRKDNIEIRASKDYNETSFKIDPSGAFINKPLDMGNNRISNVEDPMFLQDVATKAYVDANTTGNLSGWAGYPALFNIDANSKRITNMAEPLNAGDAATKGYVDGIAGIAATVAEGELVMTRDTGNDANVSAASAGPLRFTRIGRTVTLSGTINVTADSAGAATAAFTGITGAALPATNNTWRSTILDTSSHQTKPLNIMVYPAGDFRFTVVGADAGASYRISFVMAYRSAA